MWPEHSLDCQTPLIAQPFSLSTHALTRNLIQLINNWLCCITLPRWWSKWNAGVACVRPPCAWHHWRWILPMTMHMDAYSHKLQYLLLLSSGRDKYMTAAAARVQSLKHLGSSVMRACFHSMRGMKGKACVCSWNVPTGNLSHLEPCVCCE